jgi:hypothetical protein
MQALSVSPVTIRDGDGEYKPILVVTVGRDEYYCAASALLSDFRSKLDAVRVSGLDLTVRAECAVRRGKHVDMSWTAADAPSVFTAVQDAAARAVKLALAAAVLAEDAQHLLS